MSEPKPSISQASDGRLYYGPTPSGKFLDIQSDALPAGVAPRVVECWKALAGVPLPIQAVTGVRETLHALISALQPESAVTAEQMEDLCVEALELLGEEVLEDAP